MHFDMQAFQRGDRKQWDSVFKDFYNAICDFARQRLPDDAFTEDIVMNNFLSLWNQRYNLKDKHHIIYFLYVAVRNECIKYNRRFRVKQEAYNEITWLTGAAAIDPHHKFDYMEHLNNVCKAISDLPRETEQVFRMSYFESLDIATIARKLKKSPKTVLNQRRKAVKSLYNKLAASKKTTRCPVVGMS